MSRIDAITVRPIAGAIGAEILGVDLSVPLDDRLVKQIRQIFLRHLVVFFRDQRLTPAQLLDLGRRFGTPTTYPFIEGIAGYPEVIEVVKAPHEKTNFGGIWHTDTAYLKEPPMGSLLLALAVLSCGGDTLFANMYMAYETLSDGMKKLLSRLRGVNSSAKADVTRTRENRIASNPAVRSRKVFQAIHPAVRTHPETGRKALYVNFGHTVRFDGMTAEESAPILEFLFCHLTRP